ncbi:fluoride efflux transporter CrcB [Maribacter sp. CXY002]|uniref:fluoride efflux transporter CrcB n=1 Tax=Maribacter luteocoastalis TaxID=3407671 RepID=UPI003B67BEF9
MKQFLLVFLGGGVGSLLRYLSSKYLNPIYPNFYLGTFLVNTIGCLLIGLLIGLSFKNNYLSQGQSLLLVTGFCGGFTTFSSFAFEGHSLLKDASILHFSIYTIGSLLIGILAVSFGIWLSKML